MNIDKVKELSAALIKNEEVCEELRSYASRIRMGSN
ncbi:hypothetical protein [Salmonella phage SD-1_S14]|nr:hypothetical protein [Salmonella phage SD-1_S14]